MERASAAVNVSYRGLAISRGARWVPEGDGGFVEVEQPMPVGTEIVLHWADTPPVDDARALVAKVLRVTETGRAGAQVKVVGRTDVVVAFPEVSAPEAVPMVATQPLSSASGAALAAALAGAGSGSGPVAVAPAAAAGASAASAASVAAVAAALGPAAAPAAAAAPAPAPAPAPAEDKRVADDVEIPPSAPARKQSVMSVPVAVIGGAKDKGDGDDKVNLKELEVEGDGPGGGKKGGKGGRKRRNTLIGR
ncbi:MAG: hypothetical protein IT370_17705 [Deltaproteobacteria bacterium]|nr:hypothetical protein [Deltaproteobacteria bacterium]